MIIFVLFALSVSVSFSFKYHFDQKAQCFAMRYEDCMEIAIACAKSEPYAAMRWRELADHYFTQSIEFAAKSDKYHGIMFPVYIMMGLIVLGIMMYTGNI